MFIIDDYVDLNNYFVLLNMAFLCFNIFAFLFNLTSNRKNAIQGHISVFSGSISSWALALILMGEMSQTKILYIMPFVICFTSMMLV